MARNQWLNILTLLYGLGIFIAWWEMAAIQTGDQPVQNRAKDDPEIMASLSDLLDELYPGQTMPHHWQGMRAFREDRFDDARQHFEAAIAAGGKHEDLLYWYAITLTSLDADDREIQQAIDNWRWNYPHSANPDPRESIEYSKVMDDFKQGIANFHAGDDLQRQEAKTQLKSALKRSEKYQGEIKTEEFLFSRAVAMILTDADKEQVEAAIEKWKKNYGASTEFGPEEAVAQMQKRSQKK